MRSPYSGTTPPTTNPLNAAKMATKAPYWSASEEPCGQVARACAGGKRDGELDREEHRERITLCESRGAEQPGELLALRRPDRDEQRCPVGERTSGRPDAAAAPPAPLRLHTHGERDAPRHVEPPVESERALRLAVHDHANSRECGDAPEKERDDDGERGGRHARRS